MDGLTISAAIIGGLLAIICALMVVVVSRTGTIQKEVTGKVSKNACHSIREKQQKQFDNHFHDQDHVVVKVS